MNVLIRRLALPLVATGALWLLSVILFGLVAELILGGWDAGRAFPFANAHLLQEAAEGMYLPIEDPVFVLFSIAVAATGFGLAAFWGAYRATTFQLAFVSTASLIDVALFALHLRSTFTAESSAPITNAALFVLAVSAIAAGVGITASRYVYVWRA